MTASLTIAGHTMGTPDLSVPDALRLFHRAGLDAAEVVWQDGFASGIPETDSGAVLRETAAVSRELGLPVIGLTPYMSGLNSPDRSTRERDIARFRSCIGDAAELGAHIIRVYAGEFTEDQAARGEHAERWTRLVASLRSLGPIAHDHGVVLAVENHFNTMTMTARESAELVREVSHPAVGILYDQANLTFTHSEDFPEAIAVQAGLIRHVHVKDLVWVDRERPFTAAAVATVAPEERTVRSRAVGDGELDWPGILASLLETGYRGVLSLEYEYRWHPNDLPDPEEGFRRGADHTRSILSRLTDSESLPS